MKFLLAISSIAMLGLSLPAHSYGVADSFEVETVRVDSSGKGYVRFVTELIDTPAACGQAYGRMLAFDTNVAAGRAIMSLALAAKATGRKIYGRGNGQCSIYSAVETWEWGEIQ